MLRGKVACSMLLVVLAVVPASAQASHAEPLALQAIDDARSRYGLPALRDSPALGRSARAYSRFMIASDFFGHLSRIRAAAGFRLRGEALEMHGGLRPRVRMTVRNWLRSPVHRAVLLSTRYRFAGVGLARGRFGRARATVWTLQVGTR